MKNLYKFILTLVAISSFTLIHAYPNYPIKGKINELKQRLTPRADCAPSTSSIDMSINNVRARLLAGGDVWWDLQSGNI